jgi:hypothetical protein
LIGISAPAPTADGLEFPSERSHLAGPAPSQSQRIGALEQLPTFRIGLGKIQCGLVTWAAVPRSLRSSDMRVWIGYSMNVRKQNEKQPGYTNLTRLKSFVNLQLEIDSLHSFSSLIFALRNERILS